MEQIHNGKNTSKPNVMSKIRFNTEKYDSLIVDGNVELQSLSETIIFDGLGKEITEDGEREFFRLPYAGERLSTFLSEWIETNLQCYVDSHREEAQVVPHFNN